MFEIDDKQKKSIEFLKNHYGCESTKILLILKDKINLKREDGFHLTDIHLMINVQFEMEICYGNFQRWLYRKNNTNTNEINKPRITKMSKVKTRSKKGFGNTQVKDKNTIIQKDN